MTPVDCTIRKCVINNPHFQFKACHPTYPVQLAMKSLLISIDMYSSGTAFSTLIVHCEVSLGSISAKDLNNAATSEIESWL